MRQLGTATGDPWALVPALPATASSKEANGAMRIKASAKPAVGASGAQMMVQLPLCQRQPLLHRPREEPLQQPPRVIGIVLVVHVAVVTFPLGSLGLNRHFATPTPCLPPLLTTLTVPNFMEQQLSLRVWEGEIGCRVDVANAGRSQEPATYPDFLG